MLDGSGPSGVAVNVKSDAMWVGMKSARSNDIVGTQGDVTRLRFIVEGGRTFLVGNGASFTPSAEVGLRHDAGDAETGAGLEVGAGVRYAVGTLSVEGRARALVAHEASGYEERGLSGAVRVAPGASGTGLTLSIAPEWGRTGSASQRRWSARDASELGGSGEFEAEGRLEAQVGYGFALAHRRGVLTPFGALTLGNAGSLTMPRRRPVDARRRPRGDARGDAEREPGGGRHQRTEAPRGAAVLSGDTPGIGKMSGLAIRRKIRVARPSFPRDDLDWQARMQSRRFGSRRVAPRQSGPERAWR